jgi:phosphatidylglycerophosphatase A
VGLALACGDSFGSFLYDALAKKVGSRKIILIGLSMAALALMMLFLVGLPYNGALLLLIATLFVLGGSLTASCLTTDAVKMDPRFIGISSSLIYFSRFFLSSIILLVVVFLHETILTVNYIILFSLFICFFKFLKIRKFA